MPEIRGYDSSTVVNRLTASKKERDILEVPIPESLRLESRLALSTAIQLAWAVVCRAYGGGDEIRFGYQCLLSQDFVQKTKTELEEVFYPEIRTVMLGSDVPIESLDIQPVPLKAAARNGTSPASEIQCMIQVWGIGEDKTNHNYYAQNLLASMSSIAPVNMTVLAAKDEVWLHLRLESSTRLAAVGRHLAGAFRQALIEITTRPSITMAHLNLVSVEAEKQIYQWSGCDTVSERADQCSFEIIDKQPHLTQAVDSWDGELTYGQLSRFSSLLAMELKGPGAVSDGDYVPICFEKSAWAVVAMLAIHKAGAAFVPVDPSCPTERFKDIMSQIQAKLILTSVVGMGMSSVKSVANFTAAKVIIIERNILSRLASVDHCMPVRACLTSPAYCLFTSGSTGKPKGVVVEHQALSASLQAHGPALGLNMRSRALQNTSYTFDVSITEIFGTLLHGGCLCIPQDAERIHETVACMNRMKVNWAFFTPSFAQILEAHAVSSLETLVFGGEAPTIACIEQWKAPRRRLINAYGPTECTIFSMTGDVDLDSRSVTNIGRPVGGTAFIVDPEDPSRLMPIGAPGELLLAGAILARGYLGDAEKTADFFIEPPSWSERLGLEPKTKMYKTGDLVQYCHDGTVEYLGRKDRQVKLNGQRLELGEIEKAISLCYPSVTVVVDGINPEFQPNLLILVAFVAFNHTSEGDEAHVLSADRYHSIMEEIRSSLFAVLPRYMIPSYFVPLSHIPLSAAGKTDRDQLKTLARGLMNEERVKPAREERKLTETEDIIRRAWSDVLSVPCNELGLDDSFLRYGDSLAAIQLIRRLRNDSLQLRMKDVFQCTSVSQMATRVQQLSTVPGTQSWEPFSLIADETCSKLVIEAAEQCRVNQDAVKDIYPCAPMQEALMAVAAHHPNAYQGRFVYRLPEQLDLQRFQESWRLVMQAHPILRTRVIASSQSLMQVVLDVEPDWSLGANLDEYLENQSLRPVVLGGALSHLAVVHETVGLKSTFFVWTINHILYDGHSLPVVFEDVRRAYYNMPQIHRLPFQYFIRGLATESLDHRERFWRQNLEGFTTMAFPRKHHPEYCPLADSMTSLHSTFKNPSRQFPRSIQLQAAWAFLFSRYVESDDVVFGVTLNGRSGLIPGIEDIVGPTLNTLPFRVRIDRQQSIHAFMHEIQSHISQILEFETLGLQKVRQLSPSAAWACEFQTIFVVQPPLPQVSSLLFKEDSLVLSDEVIAGRALSIEAQLVEGRGVDVRAHFDSSIMTTQQVDRMLHQWNHILHQLTEGDLGRQLGSISELSTQDRLQATLWNSNAPQIQENTLHGLISKWALQSPLKGALCGWDASLTYSELSSITDHLALRLRAMGVSSGDMVPLCLEKSSYAIVCMISVLKLGAAFVPLEVRHPPERLAGTVSQTQASLVLTSPQYRHLWTGRGHLVIEEELLECLSRTTEETSLPPVSPRNVAYVIFTSGSSGQPKGVMIQHQAICTSLISAAKILGPYYSDRALQFASYSFDASIMEIFGTLLAGGTVCTPSQEECLDSLSQSLCKYEPTWSVLTPSVIQILCPSDARSFKTLVLGGESITSAAVARWKDNVTLFNAYGPTECSIICAANHVQGLQDVGVIGHPMGSAHWVVDPDDHHRLLPIGTVGELLVEGPIVAKGYLNDPDRTAAVFINHPTWRQAIGMVPRSSCMYKTGDLVRWNENGSLSYIGRKDLQVKVRGQRLELEEIESKIVHDGLDQGAIIQPKNGPFAKRLVALFTLCHRPAKDETETELIAMDLRPEAATIMTSLKTKLSGVLPEYMVPDVWIPVANFPLSSAGKTNRKHLIESVEMMSEITRGQINRFIEESHSMLQGQTSILTPMEETLRTIWSDLLNVPVARINGGTSFLHIGGDSVSAMQFVGECRTQRLSLSVRDVLQFKTLSKVAQRTRSVSQMPQVRETVATGRPHSLSPIQQMFLDTLTTEHIPGFSQTFLLRIKHVIEPAELVDAIQAIVIRHHMLRARFGRDAEGKWSQYISEDTEGSYSVLLHEISVDEETIPTLTKVCRERLNPSEGPVLTGEVFECAGKSCLFLAAHHLVIDLVSWRIIFKDLELLLRSLDLPPTSSLAFPTWCVEQEKWSSTNLHPDRVLPAPLPEPRHDYWGMADRANTYGMAKRYTMDISPGSSSQILALCANSGRLEFLDVVTGALAIAFSRVFSDRELPPIFLEHHGREPWAPEIDITQTVGWFTTLLPVFGSLLGDAPNPDVADVLRRARDCRRRVPTNGWEFFSSTFLHPQGRDAFRGFLQPEILLNYEGSFQQLERADGMFELIPQVDGDLADMSPNAPRLALLEFAVQLQNGGIGLSCMYNRNMRYTSRIEHCVREYARVLAEIPDILASSAPIYSLGDFPRVSLTYHDLDGLVKPASEHGIEDIYPILPIQDLMLTQQVLNPMLYVPRLAFRVKARGRTICHADISRAWKETVKRYSVLRTIFVNDTNGDVKFQVVLTELEPKIAYVEATQKVASISPCPPPWSQDKAPHQVTIYSQPGEDPLLLLEISHALVDVTTMTILLKHLVGGIEGTATRDCSAAQGYGDLIDHVFASSAVASSTAFWEDRIPAGPDSLVASRSLTDGHDELHTCAVPLGDTVLSLRPLLQNREISLPSVFRLAWSRVIQRHLGIDDVTFGFVLSGRDINISHIHEMAGPFLTFIPCRVNFNPQVADVSVPEALLKKLDLDYIESLAHQSHAPTACARSFDTIINFRKHGIDRLGHRDQVPEEHIWLEIVGSVDPYHHSVALEIDDWDTQIDANLTFWKGLVTSDLAAKFASALVDEITTISVRLQASDADKTHSTCLCSAAG